MPSEVVDAGTGQRDRRRARWASACAWTRWMLRRRGRRCGRQRGRGHEERAASMPGEVGMDPGLHLPLSQQAALRAELREIAQAALFPVPDYQCLSSSRNALDDKLIVVAYTGSKDDDEANEQTDPRHAVAFASAVYLDVPTIELAVIHTGLTVAVPSLQRTGILAQLYAQLFLNVMPLHGHGTVRTRWMRC